MRWPPEVLPHPGEDGSQLRGQKVWTGRVLVPSSAHCSTADSCLHGAAAIGRGSPGFLRPIYRCSQQWSSWPPLGRPAKDKCERMKQRWADKAEPECQHCPPEAWPSRTEGEKAPLLAAKPALAPSTRILNMWENATMAAGHFQYHWVHLLLRDSLSTDTLPALRWL